MKLDDQKLRNKLTRGSWPTHPMQVNAFYEPERYMKQSENVQITWAFDTDTKPYYYQIYHLNLKKIFLSI